MFAAQKHASLQNTKGVLHQLFGALTGRLGTWLGVSRIGFEVPDLAMVGDPVPVVVTAEDEDPTLALQVVATREDSTSEGSAHLLRNVGGGRYETELTGLAPGTYRISAASAVPQRPVDAVTDITLVWDPEATE